MMRFDCKISDKTAERVIKLDTDKASVDCGKKKRCMSDIALDMTIKLHDRFIFAN
jgi:hypothetical protein